MPHSETTRESARHLEQASNHLASLAQALTRTAPNEESKHLTAQAIQRALKDVMRVGAAIHPLALRAYPKSSRADARQGGPGLANAADAGIYRHIRGFRAPPDAVWRPRNRFRIGSDIPSNGIRHPRGGKC